ncbi:MAG TPA: NAD(P)H-dependent oxidoreductase subunit E [Tetragenococcus sp.]|nr:NAD(P)H-dependent oxidoreductase subunit E [Tetragenococcus sp.]
MTDLSLARKIEIIDHYDKNPEQVLNILVDMQFESEDGYIDQETAQLVAQELKVTETRVFEKLTFYSILKYKPQARYVLKICNSAPCKFSGGSLVRDALKEILGVDEYEETPDGQFMYHGVPCMGVCDQDPVIKIKDQVFANLDFEKITELITELKTGKYPEL